jgi:hypothetical protein
MIDLIILILKLALDILAQQQVGGSIPQNASSLLNIIAVAKKAYEQEVGQPLDVDKIKPYEPV